jgi:hypothetical protein
LPRGWAVRSSPRAPFAVSSGCHALRRGSCGGPCARWCGGGPARRLRVFHIHGAADRVLPAELGHPDVVVSGGGHALSLYSPSVVNEFIAGVVQVVAPNRSHSPPT